MRQLAAWVCVLALTASASAQSKRPLTPVPDVNGSHRFESRGVVGHGIGTIRSREASSVAARARHIERASGAFEGRHLQGRLQSRVEERRRVGTVRMPAAGELRIEPREIPLRERLAHIDRLRDRAIASGNVEQLEAADRLERQIRTQFGQRSPQLAGLRRQVAPVTPERRIADPANRTFTMARRLEQATVSQSQPLSPPLAAPTSTAFPPAPAPDELMNWLTPSNLMNTRLQAGQWLGSSASSAIP